MASNEDHCYIRGSKRLAKVIDNKYYLKIKGGDYDHHLLPKFLTLSPRAIAQKFDLINRYELKIAAKPKAFLQHSNISARDRYPNIKPWAHNTIQLKGQKFPENYINASPVELNTHERFIATQGPGPGDTMVHFWQMIWQEKVRVIIMLTQFIEAGRVKCGVYMPIQQGEKAKIQSKSIPLWGELECVTRQVEEWGEVRNLRILRKRSNKRSNAVFEEQLVCHLLFMRWPDHQVPIDQKDQTALLNLINLSRQKISHSEEHSKAYTPPRIVHCSAGVGRTGTFIALDSLLRRLEEGELDHLEDSEDPILDTVRRLREKRMGLVNNLQQYAFIYQVLRNKWELRNLHAKKSILPDDSLKALSKRRRIMNFPE